MSTQTKTKIPKDNLDHANPAALPTLGKGKEQESASLSKEEDEIIAQITTTAEAMDQEMEARVKEQLTEAKLAHPKPEIPPDVEDAGVRHPETDAQKVVRDGPTLNVNVDEGTYKKGLHQKVAGAVKDKVVVGVSSLAALAMWVGRLIKMAHKHTMKVVFRKKGN